MEKEVEMNIYEKVQTMRCELQSKNIRKSGENKFAGYSYFELADILPLINDLMKDHKVSSEISFSPETCTLKIINAEKPDEIMSFACPMAKALLKGCHEVQNLGASITYIRRYLYLNAFEIVENEIVDAQKPLSDNTPARKQEKKPDTIGDAAKREEINSLMTEVYGEDYSAELEKISGFQGSNGWVNGKKSIDELKGKWLEATLNKVRKEVEEVTGRAIE